jgi:hypothetical protein
MPGSRCRANRGRWLWPWYGSCLKGISACNPLHSDVWMSFSRVVSFRFPGSSSSQLAIIVSAELVFRCGWLDCFPRRAPEAGHTRKLSNKYVPSSRWCVHLHTRPSRDRLARIENMSVRVIEKSPERKFRRMKSQEIQFGAAVRTIGSIGHHRLDVENEVRWQPFEIHPVHGNGYSENSSWDSRNRRISVKLDSRCSRQHRTVRRSKVRSR